MYYNLELVQVKHRETITKMKNAISYYYLDRKQYKTTDNVDFKL